MKPPAPPKKMGRPRTSTLVCVSFKLEPKLIALLDHFAATRYGGNRTAALVACVESAAKPVVGPCPTTGD